MVVDVELQSTIGQERSHLQSRHAHEEVTRDLHMEIAEICPESHEKRGEKSLIKSDINGRLIQRRNLQGTGDPGGSSSGRHRAQDAVALDREDLHHAVKRRGVLEAEASGGLMRICVQQR